MTKQYKFGLSKRTPNITPFLPPPSYPMRQAKIKIHCIKLCNFTTTIMIKLFIMCCNAFHKWIVNIKTYIFKGIIKTNITVCDLIAVNERSLHLQSKTSFGCVNVKC